MGVASGCGEQEVGVASGSGWNLWVWLLGVVVGRYIDFLILLIPTPLVYICFLQQHFCFLMLERRMPNSYFFTSRGAYVNLRYIAMLYTYSIGNQP